MTAAVGERVEGASRSTISQTTTRWSESGRNSWFRRLNKDNWHVHHGMRLHATVISDAREAAVIEKLKAALDVLHNVAPQQLARLPECVHTIIAFPLWNALGRWRRDLRSVLLDTEFVLASDTTPALIATVIVHELTHARLDRAGFKYTRDTRGQCERICNLAERNFIARMPASKDREDLEAFNSWYLAIQPEFWTDAAIAKRHAEWRAEQPFWRRLLVDLASLIRRVPRFRSTEFY